MEMSLNEWVAESGIERDDCFKHGYRDLYLDIGFFIAQFANIEFALSYLLLLTAEDHEPQAIDSLLGGVDAQEKIDRLREECASRGGMGGNLAARLTVFEEQSVPLRNKLRQSTILPGDDWPESYEFFSAFERLKDAPRGPDWAEASENMRADRIWKHGIWLHEFLGDLGTVALNWAVTGEFEIIAPRTPVLEAEQH